MQRITIRDHVISPQHNLDRVKLSIQKGPLGSLDRPDAERLAALWNATCMLSEADLIQILADALVLTKERMDGRL
jgi:hypothetical protein